jgi:subtilisin family serine protease
MKFARRNRSTHIAGTRSRRSQGGAARHDNLLESLESRVLLSVNGTTVTWNGQATQAVAGQYIVKSALPAQQLVNQMRAAGLQPSSITSLATGGVGSDTYLIVDKVTPAAAVNWWGQRAAGVVTAIGPNFVVRERFLPNEFTNAANRPNLWYLNNQGGLPVTDINGNVIPGVAGADIGMAYAWNLGTGTRTNAVVAVLDTGVDYTHPDLVANMWRNPGDGVADMVDNDGSGVVDDIYGANFSTIDANGVIVPDGNVLDADGHGTHVAGIIGAVGNNVNVGQAVGINWATQIMAVKVLDDTGAGTAANILAGLNYVQFMKQVRGINIVAINMSLGFTFEGPFNGIGDPTGVAQLFSTMQQLNNSGVFISVAAGNTSFNNDQTPDFPSSFGGNLFLSVAATNAADQLSSFSNFGPQHVRIAAPGEEIFALNAGGTYQIASGTSSASPMVAGAFAFLRSLVPSASPGQVLRAILDGADQLPQLQGAVENGRRLNVFRAAEILLGNRPVAVSIDAISNTSISGWAFDPNLGADNVAGYVLVDGTTVIPFTTNVRRPDVDQVVYDDAPRRNSGSTRGFTVNFGQLGPGTHRIDVFINDVSQVNGRIQDAAGNYFITQRLVASKVFEGNQLPIGSVDVATANAIVGWAWDPNGGNVNVRIDIDGQTVATVPANQFHSPAVGNQKYSYVPSLAQGTHRVDVYALDDFTGQPVLIGSRTVSGNSGLVTSPSGLTYNPNTGVLSGYVVDPDSPFDPVTLQIVIDGQSGGSRQLLGAVANQADQDNFTAVNLPKPGNNKHGFSIQLPNLAAGTHTVQVFAFDNETGTKTEVLQTPVFVNRRPTGSFYRVDQNVVSAWGINVVDPDSPNTPIVYRIDVDNWTGPLQVAPNVGAFTLAVEGNFLDNALTTITDPVSGLLVLAQIPVALKPGTHNARLFVRDNETLEMVQITQDFFGNQQPNGIALGGAGGGIINGTVNTQPSQNGLAYFNFAQQLGISGTVNDPNMPANVNETTYVDLYVDGNPTPALTQAVPGRNGAFHFRPEDLIQTLGYGLHYIEIHVVDPYTPVQPAPNFTQWDLSVVLAQGLVSLVSPDQTNAAKDYAAAVLKDVNLQTISGVAAANVNDPVPATWSNLSNYTPGATTFRIDVNNSAFTVLHTTPSVPAQGVTFTVNTPALNSSANNVANIWYSDPFTGTLRLLDTRAMDPARAFTFVNRRLTLSGNLPPNGNLDSATASTITGWVRDADLPGQAIQYRLDYDNMIGVPQTADQLRTDLPFTLVANDQKHGFQVTPPQLAPGTHTVKLWAIDPTTQQQVLIGSRSFTVVNNNNALPIGNVDAISGARVAGWVQDPTTPTWDVAIELVVDGASFGKFPTTFARADVVRNGASGRGFDFAMPASVAAGRHLVQVFAVDTTDASRKVLLQSLPVDVGAPTISGNFDLANATAIAGWGRGAVNDATPTFRVDINGVPYQTFPGTPSVENGVTVQRFVLPSPPIGSAAANTVTLYYIDPISKLAILVATKVIAPVQMVTGSLDAASTSLIQGWAFSPTDPTRKVTVQLVIDNVEIATTTAGLDRPDLIGQFAGHAYEFTVPQLAPGVHSVYVRFRDPITGEYAFVTNSAVIATV